MVQTSWRQQFIDLSESLFRELGFPPPSQLHEESLPLAMSLEVEGKAFELVHSSSFQTHRILISCCLGKIAHKSNPATMAALLRSNLACVRGFGAWFGINPETDDLCRLEFRELGGCQAAPLLEQLRHIAQEMAGWDGDRLSLAAGTADAQDESFVGSLA